MNTTAAAGACPPRGISWRRAYALALALPAVVAQAEVVVYTDRHHPVTAPAGTRTVHLDAAERIAAELAARLPQEPSDAAQVVRLRLQEGGGTLQLRMASAANGVVEAWRLGIRKVPAVVVDGRYVVYGEKDVARALQTIARHRETRP